MKRKYELNLPDSCQVLKNDEMIQSEGGWYCDISDKKLLLTNDDLLNLGGSKILNLMKKIGITEQDIQNIKDKLFPTQPGVIPVLPINPPKTYGVGISYKNKNLNVWKITSSKEFELASSNKISW